MTHRTILTATTLLAATLACGSAHAALQGRDLNGSIGSFEAYYDTVLDITWLADANYAQTSGHDADGKMTWADATIWAANLSFYNPLTNQTYADWRLPTTLQPDASCSQASGGVSWAFLCTGSEMGHLFYNELGGTAGLPISYSADPDLAKFANLQDHYYWSATEFAPDTFQTWNFRFDDGSQRWNGKGLDIYALAVSPGDVAAVPEADTWAMLLAGLGLVGAAARRKHLLARSAKPNDSQS